MSGRPESTTTRGDATREALLTAAIELFGRHGYDATSNRQLAEAAGVNQALIGYHFGSKHGLYLAVFEHIAHEIGRRVGSAAERTTVLLGEDAEPEREELIEGVLAVTDRLVLMMASPETTAWARLIIREQQDPSDAFDIVYEKVMSRIVGAVAGLVARLAGQPSASPDSRLLTMTLVGQALLFRTSHAAVLRTMGWQAFGPSEITAIQNRIRRNVISILSQENPS